MKKLVFLFVFGLGSAQLFCPLKKRSGLVSALGLSSSQYENISLQKIIGFVERVQNTCVGVIESCVQDNDPWFGQRVSDAIEGGILPVETELPFIPAFLDQAAQTLQQADVLRAEEVLSPFEDSRKKALARQFLVNLEIFLRKIELYAADSSFIADQQIFSAKTGKSYFKPGKGFDAQKNILLEKLSEVLTFKPENLSFPLISTVEEVISIFANLVINVDHYNQSEIRKNIEEAQF